MKATVFSVVFNLYERITQKRKWILLYSFISLLAAAPAHVRCASFNHKNESVSNELSSFNILKEDIKYPDSDPLDDHVFDLEGLNLKYEHLDELGNSFFRHNNKKIYMAQYAANNPIQDRCFAYNINMNNSKLAPINSYQKIKEKEDRNFIKSFDKMVLKSVSEAAPSTSADFYSQMMNLSFLRGFGKGTHNVSDASASGGSAPVNPMAPWDSTILSPIPASGSPMNSQMGTPPVGSPLGSRTRMSNPAAHPHMDLGPRMSMSQPGPSMGSRAPMASRAQGASMNSRKRTPSPSQRSPAAPRKRTPTSVSNATLNSRTRFSTHTTGSPMVGSERPASISPHVGSMSSGKPIPMSSLDASMDSVVQSLMSGGSLRAGAEEVANNTTVEADRKIEEEAAAKTIERTVESVEAQPFGFVETQASENVENQASENVENQASENVENQASENVENQASENVENQASESVENKASESVDNQASENVENQASENVVNQESENVENQESESVENQESENVENQESENVENQESENVENQESENVENQESENVENQESENVENQESENVENQESENVENLESESVENKESENVENLASENVKTNPIENINFQPTKHISFQSVKNLAVQIAENMGIHPPENITSKPFEFNTWLNSKGAIAGPSRGQANEYPTIEDVSKSFFARYNPFYDHEKSVNNTFLFAAVIDGHGGEVIADVVKKWLGFYVKRQLLEKLRKSEQKVLTPNDIIKSLEAAHLQLDDDILKKAKEYFFKGSLKFTRCGACSLSVLMDKSDYYISNIGDSKGLLIKNKTYVRLNNIHNASELSERRRLIQEHPNEMDVVMCKRPVKNGNTRTAEIINLTDQHSEFQVSDVGRCYVKGRLQCTRNFGDFYLKHKIFAFDYKKNRFIVKEPHSFPYITANPEVIKLKRSGDDEFIVLVSDGISDHLSDKEIFEIVKHNNYSVSKITKMLIETVIMKAAMHARVPASDFISRIPTDRRRKFYDDMSVVVIKLK
ncbi:protein phosphatase 2C domain containing protein [Plasmodium gonderi]|uniref:Protein phosphatase 2C domain containing protein n=1 Tax=Plasmodium gonderi TaxID=77519 RepID=A0A1Y1JIU0_PLAGO|nr:protein phosphatase 2C domain containing protein [Plasmodium gonderi]GAW81117.1 protein phosphatase 2C domain containing protein [Plasmodium gonderi]